MPLILTLKRGKCKLSPVFSPFIRSDPTRPRAIPARLVGSGLCASPHTGADTEVYAYRLILFPARLPLLIWPR